VRNHAKYLKRFDISDAVHRAPSGRGGWRAKYSIIRFLDGLQEYLNLSIARAKPSILINRT
jgi:hypothetical protein